tara:strand:- start:1000 stop:1269 length:270 start_codon:yes stop_codon:yes gene_type:complete
MSNLSIMFIVLLSLSVTANMFLFWYSFRAATMVLRLSENLEEMKAVIDNFADHVDQVHEMEMFYGDETLAHLLRHAKELSEVIREYLTE